MDPSLLANGHITYKFLKTCPVSFQSGKKLMEVQSTGSKICPSIIPFLTHQLREEVVRDVLRATEDGGEAAKPSQTVQERLSPKEGSLRFMNHCL